MNCRFQKTVVGILLIIFVLPNLFFSPEVKAQTGVSAVHILSMDPASIAFYDSQAIQTAGINASAGTTAGATTGQFARFLAELTERIAWQALKRVILDRLVDATIEWIQGGAKGAIISDWNSFLNQAGEDALGLLIEEIPGLNFLCSPFNLQLQALLAPVPRFSQQLTCTLDTVFGNIENFFEDFETGGWIGYTQLWQPQNNFYGASLIAANEAVKRQDAARDAARSEGVAGQGYRSYYQCEDPSRPETCKIQTPGAFVGAAAHQGLINAQFDFVIASDIAAYVSAIADAAINQLVKVGVEGLQDYVKDEIQDVSQRQDCTGLSGVALRACLGVQNIFDSNLETDRTTYLSQIDGTLLPRREADNFLNQSFFAQTTLVQELEFMLEAARERGDTTEEQACNLALTAAEELQSGLEAKTQDNLDFIDTLENAASEIQAADDYTSLTLNFQNIGSFLDAGISNQLLTDAQSEQATIEANVEADIEHIRETGTCPAVRE